MADAAAVEVLVVEDNPADAMRVREALDRGGRGRFHPTVVGGLGDARPRLGAADLVLLDLTLPDSEGAETVARVKEVVPGTAVVVLSGERDDEVAFRCLQHGAQDVLLKGTLDGYSLARALTCALERQALARERDEALRIAPRTGREAEEAVRRLAAGIARDLADPLAEVVAGAFELCDGHDATAFGPALRIQRAGWRATSLARLLAACAGESKATMEAVDLNGFVLERRDRIEEHGTAAVAVDRELDPSLPRVLADRRLLEIALQILVRHGRDSMPSGGILTVGTRWSSSRPRGNRGGERGFVALEVSDTGPGYGPRDCRRMFEPYFTTDVLGIGTGLGLAPVLGIGRQCGGSAVVESHPGRGTTVRVLLPPVAEEGAVLGESDAASRPGTGPVGSSPAPVRIVEFPGPDPLPGGAFPPSARGLQA